MISTNGIREGEVRDFTKPTYCFSPKEHMHSENGEPHSAIEIENIFQEAAAPSLRSDLCNVSKGQNGGSKVITVTTNVNSGF